MKNTIKSIANGSPAAGTAIAPGDILRKINGNIISDVLDYRYHTYDARLTLELEGADGKLKIVNMRKPPGADIGLEFETFLMDKERSCANKCIFCFIDQLPSGMRETLYYKDDDLRLSFLQGNYVTLTNLSRRDIERIIKLRISPINVSVHTLDPQIRSYMLGTKNGAAGLGALKALANAGITLNCQIVCCPGINDAAHLARTIEGLIKLGDSIHSVSIVPVGLTKHRQSLPQLNPFTREQALETIHMVNRYGETCINNLHSRIFYCADEMYIIAGLKLPPHAHYEDYPQLENGVGMMRLFMTEFKKAAATSKALTPSDAPFSIATGTAAARYLTNLLKIAKTKCDKISGNVYAIENNFFGHSVNVSGLITGQDITAQLKNRDLGTRLLIPINMLRRGEDVFLDGTTVAELSETLGVPVKIIPQNGAALLHAIL